jgi:TolA-binding protein
LRRSLLDLNNQIEALRAELAKLRGSDEQLSRDLAEVQRRQKDVGQALDERLRKLEPEGLTLDGRKSSSTRPKSAPTTTPWPPSAQATSSAPPVCWPPFSGAFRPARIWTRCASGRAMRCTASATTRRRSPSSGPSWPASPDHPRAPEALLALANSQAEMKDPRGARKTIDELLKAYPKSEAAQAGKERLAAIK